MRKERSTETMIPVSMVSRKTMKKMGTAKTLGIVPATPNCASDGRVWWQVAGAPMRQFRLRWRGVKLLPNWRACGISDPDLIRWAGEDLIKESEIKTWATLRARGALLAVIATQKGATRTPADVGLVSSAQVRLLGPGHLQREHSHSGGEMFHSARRGRCRGTTPFFETFSNQPYTSTPGPTHSHFTFLAFHSSLPRRSVCSTALFCAYCPPNSGADINTDFCGLSFPAFANHTLCHG